VPSGDAGPFFFPLDVLFLSVGELARRRTVLPLPSDLLSGGRPPPLFFFSPRSLSPLNRARHAGASFEELIALSYTLPFLPSFELRINGPPSPFSRPFLSLQDERATSRLGARGGRPLFLERAETRRASPYPLLPARVFFWGSLQRLSDRLRYRTLFPLSLTVCVEECFFFPPFRCIILSYTGNIPRERTLFSPREARFSSAAFSPPPYNKEVLFPGA